MALQTQCWHPFKAASTWMTRDSSGAGHAHDTSGCQRCMSSWMEHPDHVCPAGADTVWGSVPLHRTSSCPRSLSVILTAFPVSQGHLHSTYSIATCQLTVKLTSVKMGLAHLTQIDGGWRVLPVGHTGEQVNPLPGGRLCPSVTPLLSWACCVAGLSLHTGLQLDHRHTVRVRNGPPRSTASSRYHLWAWLFTGRWQALGEPGYGLYSYSYPPPCSPDYMSNHMLRSRRLGNTSIHDDSWFTIHDYWRGSRLQTWTQMMMVLKTQNWYLLLLLLVLNFTAVFLW